MYQNYINNVETEQNGNNGTRGRVLKNAQIDIMIKKYYRACTR